MMTGKSFDLVNGARFRSGAAVVFGAAVLVAAAWLRGAEYDEQYTLFLTAGTPRPAWPDAPFPAGAVAALQAGHAGFAAIARDLRATDVHPPLYFWAVSLWRAAFGPGLFVARLFSVLCGVGSLALVARLGGAWAVLLTTGCYGFAYTNAVARGFAPAETLLLAGAALLAARRPFWAGTALGAACACNYLAVFVAVALCAVRAAGAGPARHGPAWPGHPRLAGPGQSKSWMAGPTPAMTCRRRPAMTRWERIPAMTIVVGMAPFLALDAWFFAAQHGARAGQFPPFAVLPSVARLAGYQAAAVFGGLPLYWDGTARIAACVPVGIAALTLLARVARSGRLLLTAAAPALGILLLGAVFNNTPIELRYLSFGLPFLALGATQPGIGRSVILAAQAAGIAGLLLAPRTMQPASAAAAEAARLGGNALVLVPAGNDGVGIVGAFGIASPPSSMLRVVRQAPVPVPPEYHRVILALLAQDRDSTAALPLLRASVAAPKWRRVAIGSNLEAYEREE